MKKLIIVLILLFEFGNANAQFRKKLNFDSLTAGDIHFFPIPMLSSTPETGLFTGLTLEYFYVAGGDKDTSTRASVINILGGYTTKKQLITEFTQSSFTKNENYYFYLKGGYSNNYEKYWGSLNERTLENPTSVTYKRSYANFKIGKNIGKKNFVGLNGQWSEFSDTMLEESMSSSVANESLIPSKIIGIGGLFLHDSRNTQFSTTKGNYLELSHLLAKNRLNSKPYQSYLLDARRFDTFSRWTLSEQFFINSQVGEVPILEKLRFGGPFLMRGYIQGRFRTNHVAIFQTEGKYTLNRFFKLAVFASVGKADNQLNNLLKSETLFSGGTGLRILINRKKMIYSRIDFAVNNEKGTGFYFKLGEAF